VTANGKSKAIGPGGIVHVERGDSYRLQVKSRFARYVLVCSTPYLEERIDNMTPEQAEQARVHMKSS
jgi:hypothetical protein